MSGRWWWGNPNEPGGKGWRAEAMLGTHDLPAEATIARWREGQRKFPRNPRLVLAAFRVCEERGRREAALAIPEDALPGTTEPACGSACFRPARHWGGLG